MYHEKKWYSLYFKSELKTDNFVDTLDINILNNFIFKKHLNIADVNNDYTVTFLLRVNNDTVRNNIAYGELKGASDDVVCAAAEAGQCRARRREGRGGGGRATHRTPLCRLVWSGRGVYAPCVVRTQTEHPSLTSSVRYLSVARTAASRARSVCTNDLQMVTVCSSCKLSTYACTSASSSFTYSPHVQLSRWYPTDVHRIGRPCPTFRRRTGAQRWTRTCRRR